MGKDVVQLVVRAVVIIVDEVLGGDEVHTEAHPGHNSDDHPTNKLFPRVQPINKIGEWRMEALFFVVELFISLGPARPAKITVIGAARFRGFPNLVVRSYINYLNIVELDGIRILIAAAPTFTFVALTFMTFMTFMALSLMTFMIFMTFAFGFMRLVIIAIAAGGAV